MLAGNALGEDTDITSLVPADDDLLAIAQCEGAEPLACPVIDVQLHHWERPPSFKTACSDAFLRKVRTLTLCQHFTNLPSRICKSRGVRFSSHRSGWGLQ